MTPTLHDVTYEYSRRVGEPFAEVSHVFLWLEFARSIANLRPSLPAAQALALAEEYAEEVTA